MPLQDTTSKIGLRQLGQLECECQSEEKPCSTLECFIAIKKTFLRKPAVRVVKQYCAALMPKFEYFLCFLVIKDAGGTAYMLQEVGPSHPPKSCHPEPTKFTVSNCYKDQL